METIINPVKSVRNSWEIADRVLVAVEKIGREKGAFILDYGQGEGRECRKNLTAFRKLIVSRCNINWNATIKVFPNMLSGVTVSLEGYA